MQDVSDIPHTWLKGASSRRRALKARWGSAAKGAAPTQELRTEAREYFFVRGDLMTMITIGGFCGDVS